MEFRRKKSKDEKRMSIRNLVITSVVVIFFASIILIYNSMLYKEKRDKIIIKGELTAKKFAEQVDRYLSTNVDSIKLSAYTLDGMLIDNKSDEDIQNYLVGQSTAIKNAVNENMTGLYGYINGKFFSGTNWIPPEGYVATKRPWYIKPMENPGEITMLDPYTDLQSGNTMLALGKTLIDGESVISVDVSLDQIQSFAESEVNSGDSDLELLLNAKGVVVAHSNKNEIGKDYSKDTNSLGGEIYTKLGETNKKYFEIEYNESHYIAYVADVRDGWHTVSVKNSTAVYHSLNIILRITIFLVLFVIILISIIMTRSNRKSIIADNLSSQLSSAADIYISVHEIDLVNDSFTQVRNNNPKAVEFIGKQTKNATQTIKDVMTRFSDPSTRNTILSFVDLTTLNSRMKDHNTITTEFLSEDKIWRKARFIVSIRNDDGSLSKVMYMIEDIDVEKKQRDALIDISQRAIAASEAKSAFLSNMSHEIRTPINAVLGMNEMILRECEEPNVLAYSESIKTAGRTLLGLVNDILDFSKIEAGKMEINLVNYDLSSVVNDLVNMINARAIDKGLDLELDFDKDIPKILNGDEIRIKQVITNILTNAVKYTEKGSIVFGIGYEKIKDDPNSIILNVYVKDTGIGIKKEDMDKLFSEFERIEENRNRHVEGTGLGMNITLSLLKMMGSSLKVDSTYGVGSKFYFALKQKVVKWERLGNFEASYREAIKGRTKYRERFVAPNANLLVVDDNQMNLMVFANLLKQTKVNIDKVSSGYDCLKYTRDKKYDIIFLDHMMPKMDGIETLQRMRKDKANKNLETKVVCLTANAISGAREDYIVAGFDDYLAKPIDPLRLEEMILSYLQKDKIEYTLDVDDINNTKENHLPDFLKDIKEIDTVAGVGNNGSVEAYIGTLKVFAKNSEKYTSEIMDYYQAGDIKNATIKIHALKSTTRIIGASNIGDFAQMLENAGKSGDIKTFDSNLYKLLERAGNLGKDLYPLIESEIKSDHDKHDINEKELNEAFISIKEAANDCDNVTIEEIIENLSGYSIPYTENDKLNAIKDAMDNFDFDLILDILK